jgi:hypothetical protein
LNTESYIVDSIIVTGFNVEKINLLEKYNNLPILIIIYNNQCLGCTGRAIPLAYEYQQKFSSLKVVGIHSDFGQIKSNEKEIKSIFTSGEIPFPIYIDRNHKVYDQFESEGTPQWLLINKDKTLYRSIFGSQVGVQNRLLYALEELVNQ